MSTSTLHWEYSRGTTVIFLGPPVTQHHSNGAILRYSFCRGRDILNIHPFITLSILMVETSYCTHMEAVTCVFHCVINIFL